MIRFLIRLVGTMVGLWLSTRLVPGIEMAEGTDTLGQVLIVAGIALVFTLVNSIVLPVVKVFAFPLYILTFGLFALVTNALMFMFTGWLSTAVGLPFMTGGFLSSLAGGLLTTLCTWVAAAIAGRD